MEPHASNNAKIETQRSWRTDILALRETTTTMRWTCNDHIHRVQRNLSPKAYLHTVPHVTTTSGRHFQPWYRYLIHAPLFGSYIHRQIATQTQCHTVQCTYGSLACTHGPIPARTRIAAATIDNAPWGAARLLCNSGSYRRRCRVLGDLLGLHVCRRCHIQLLHNTLGLSMGCGELGWRGPSGGDRQAWSCGFS